ncbi:hypothetical protein H6G11_06225 [Cyanobacterium aponinum FACHB-4101]|nr:hypothetical protein [Cyanobacterium aponinum FACHB-4101]
MSKKKTQLSFSPPPHSETRNEVKVLSKLVFESDDISKVLSQVSPDALAYIGDAVYELYIRTSYLLPSKKIADYHHVVVSKVRAESQATYLQNIYPLLNDIEKDWVRRGRNAVNKSPRRLPLQTYQAASGFETLLGYLYISEPERLEFLLSHLTDVTQKYN